MRIGLVLLLLFVAVIFAAQNAGAVTIKVLAWRFDASLAIVVAIAVAVGAIGGLLAGLPHFWRLRAHEKRLRAQLTDLGGDAANRPPTPAPAASPTRGTREPV